MSLATNPKLSAFYRWLHARPAGCPRTQDELAYQVMTNRAHLSQVLSGQRRGKHTWRRLVRELPDDGLLLLKQCPSWNDDAEAAWVEKQAMADFAQRFAPKKEALAS